MEASQRSGPAPSEEWESTRERLVEAVSANFKNWFQLDEAAEIEDCLTLERVSAGSLLNEFSTRIRAFSAPPFMLQRLCELAHLTHNVSSQYKRHEGFKYLDAIIKATRVRSTDAVFDSFKSEMDSEKADLRAGIKLDAIGWLEGVDIDEVLSEAHISLEAPEYF